jgi:chemotaxis protein methyltransferase CheR
MSQELQFISDFLRSECAIVIGPDKYYLIESRLKPLLSGLGLNDLGSLVTSLRRDSNEKVRQTVVEALTTHETLFFRDLALFDDLRAQILPEIIAKRKSIRRLSIWSAAASTGQEIYSIAMLICRHFPELGPWTLDYHATDISSEVLSRAQEGLYNQFEVNRGLPADYLVNYFRKEGELWRISEDIRSMIRFRQLNLIKPWPELMRYDLIFIRNVLIYFDPEVKRMILNNVANTLADDGYLFLGGSETVLNLSNRFKRSSLSKSSCFGKS